MTKKILSFSLLAILLVGGSVSSYADGREKEGEKIIMTGFNMKDSVINKMIDNDWASMDSLGYGNLVIPREINKIPLSAFPDNALWVCKKLHDAGYEAYIVGGAVRDLLMGTDADDADILTNATAAELKPVFRDSLYTHEVGKATFCVVSTTTGNVDLSPMQPCPQSFIDAGYVKPMPGNTRLADSFSRDLPFNAIYYEPFTGTIYDYHGGLKDLRDNTIHCMIKSDPALTIKANAGGPITRIIRFQAKYGSTLDPKLDSTLTADAPHLMTFAASNGMYSVCSKMFSGGLAVKCYNSLEKYKIFESVFPCTKILKKKKEYKVWLLARLAMNDSLVSVTHKSLGRATAMAEVMYPVYRQLRQKVDSETATNQILDMQSQVMKIWEKKRIKAVFEKLYAEESSEKN